MNQIPSTIEGLRTAAVPPHLFLPRGMIIPEEQVLLYLLAREHYQGAGEIVDAGAFCGASAYSFGAGISDNLGAFARERRVHSYDLFAVDHTYTQQFIQHNFFYFTDTRNVPKFPKREVKAGESFIEVFRFQTQRYANMITEYEGSILDFQWQGAPIEILFIDVAKTLAIQQHLFRHYLPALVPGGVLLQQDFHHAFHPYIHVAMEFLAPWFEITHSRVGATRAYRLREPIPQSAMARVIAHDFSPAEKDALMRRCVESSSATEQGLLQVVHARQLTLDGDAAGVRSPVREFIARRASGPGFDWLAQQMRSAAGESAVAELAASGH